MIKSFNTVLSQKAKEPRLKQSFVMVSVLLATLSLLVSLQGITSDQSDVGLNTVEMIENHGYPCENHYITTEDGYILTYQRIPHGKNDDGSGQKPVVLLMHGLLSSSADYVNMGPDRSLAYLLSDIGYDVWLGNSRGNAWSRNHTDPEVLADAEKFYDFTWHEIGYYDLPAAIDHILEMTGNDGLYYVGHSQGCTSFMVMGSTKPEYNDKIKLASLMGPAGFMEHQSSSLLKVLGNHINEIEKLMKKYKFFELPDPKLLQQLAFGLCTVPENYQLCVNFLAVVDGEDSAQLQQEDFALILSNAPSNAGSKQFIHYGQQIKNGGFLWYDYGSEQNLELYGSETPPAYDLSKITAPVAAYYGKNDHLVYAEDAKTVVKSVSNVVNDYEIPYELFDHLDFIFAKDVVDLLYVELIKTMQAY
ncbi:hypothetical protein Zmor_010133 [Zophobas morio]|uniref:Lipase n=1 Tax=Zophobas morio TaxID=2755281 RepID=A0AA38II63_9CUCU|nr:hypothetical protein Zmor_010133 [Zophobas morio]